MSESEQITHFQTEIDKVIDRFREEYQISIASVIGVLEVTKMDLHKEHFNQDDD